MQYTSRGAEYIGRCPDVTKKGAQRPLLSDFGEGTEWHHGGGDQQVGNSKAEHEVVGGGFAEVSLTENGSNDKNVSNNGN